MDGRTLVGVAYPSAVDQDITAPSLPGGLGELTVLPIHDQQQ